MKKKINMHFMMITAMAILLTAVSAMLLYYHILKEQVFADLKAYAHMIERIDKEELIPELGGAYDPWEDALRITWMDAEGTVLYDSLADEAQMENHKERPEIKEAMEEGEGKAVRQSKTVSLHTFYYAKQLSNGDILRIGKDSSSVKTIMQHTIVLVLVIAIVLFGLCMLFSYLLTKRLVEPVEKLASNLVMVDESTVYDEMKPFVRTIKEQHINILNHAQMRQEFTANVSHELKTPLTAISGYAELIGSGITDEKDTKRFASEIHQNANRLLALINDIIKLSELDETEHTIKMEDVDLFELAKQCVETMSVAAKKQNVTLMLAGCSTHVNANKDLMEELLYNLCSNAIRYNKSGGSVTITAETREGRPYLSVEDTGIGIPKESQERVFERFYRVDKSRSKSSGGTGLGLAIVKHIVAQHEAEIKLTSEPGEGTNMEIFF